MKLKKKNIRKKKILVAPKPAPPAPPQAPPQAAPKPPMPQGAPPMGAKPPMPAQKPPMASPPAFKKGGKVKKTGMALVHKGEKVLTAKQQKKAKKK